MVEKIKEIYKKYEEIWNYLVVGGLTTLVSFAAYFIVTRTILDVNHPIQLQIANILQWIAGVLFAYFTNRKFVFKSTNENKMQEFISFTSSRVVTLILDMVIKGVMVTWLGMNDLIALVVSMVVVIIGNYVLSKFFVFNRH
ncbi:MAG: GtrA family protein [Thermoflexaceae bacterium]|nr:GtrA family protein [Thermoflexaceae bacterium]